MVEDPLGRNPGEPIDPEKHSLADLRMRERGSKRSWDALWQQNPRTVGGNLIKIEQFKLMKLEDVPTRHMQWCRAYDLAFSEKQLGRSNPSFTVGSKVGLFKEGQEYSIIIADVARWQSIWPVSRQRIAMLAKEDGPAVKIVLESGGPQKSLYDELRADRAFAPYSIRKATPVVDKVARANIWVDKLEIGKFFIVEAPWNVAFLDECESFDNGQHNDQVDSISIAYWHLSQYLRGQGIRQMKVQGLFR